ncbi:hypothetical protein BOTBODRAFT_611645 [Botryobasidium botryosum FD-172 SS1]|uniref:Uncharacterized protein n=1 Tax=Botryobasidium botryosum (strain FD-172 SS1) TaxID=930990 RepID=A0A067M728_BOTB1|nr:hypothetical protein BOTBODRAFT_611645 [Botryobasidium botryosum FD-172 SS1]
MFEQYEAIRKVCCCPTFLVSIAGPRLAIAGAVFTDRFMSQILTDDVRIGTNDAKGDINAAILRVAHILRALRHSLEELDSYYRDLKSPRTVLTPSPTSSSSTRLSTHTSSRARREAQRLTSTIHLSSALTSRGL